MDITSVQYSVDLDGQTHCVLATIDGENLVVPMNPDNRHYAAILEWVEAGNTIQEAE